MNPEINSISVDDSFDHDIRSWLADISKRYDSKYLLAHADDGVIWGQFTNNKLMLAGDFFELAKVDLRATTLQEARLFGTKGEILIWRTESGFSGRAITDEMLTKDVDYLEEEYWLWGSSVNTINKFTLMQDGQQGLLHVPPIQAEEKKAAVLIIRHYLSNDEFGQAFISCSRLVGLKIVERTI